VIILEDKNENKDWDKEDTNLLKPSPDDAIDKRQKAINNLKIKEGF
jgi:hypothetical protein